MDERLGEWVVETFVADVETAFAEVEQFACLLLQQLPPLHPSLLEHHEEQGLLLAALPVQGANFALVYSWGVVRPLLLVCSTERKRIVVNAKLANLYRWHCIICAFHWVRCIANAFALYFECLIAYVFYRGRPHHSALIIFADAAKYACET